MSESWRNTIVTILIRYYTTLDIVFAFASMTEQRIVT